MRETSCLRKRQQEEEEEESVLLPLSDWSEVKGQKPPWNRNHEAKSPEKSLKSDLSSVLGCRKLIGWEEGLLIKKGRAKCNMGRQSRTSQVLPVDGDQRLIGLLSVTNDLSDAVLTPQTLDLPVTLGTQVEGVPPPADTHTDKQINKVCVRASVCVC